MVKTRLLSQLLPWSLSIAIGCAGLGCASTKPVLDSSSAPKVSTTPPPESSRLATSVEQLESDPSFMAGESPENRAAALSGLWEQHAARLESISKSASAAARLRSTHIALNALLGNGCRNPFNPVCRDLDDRYRAGVESVVRNLARDGWALPDLSPNRYRFSLTEQSELSRLREWRIRVEQPAEELRSVRPGIGLATIGCRTQDTLSQQPLLGRVEICSPMTFILVFDGQLDGDQVSARLMAVDAYQQSVATISDQEVPVAGNIDATLQALARNVASDRRTSNGFFCLSLPTKATTTMLITGTPERLAEIANSELRAALKDERVQERITPCLAPISKTSSPSASARTLLATVREIVSPRKKVALDREPIALFLLATDQVGDSVVSAAMKRLARQRPRAQTGHGAFRVDGLYSISPATSDLPHLRPDSQSRSALGATVGDHTGTPLGEQPTLSTALQEAAVRSGTPTFGEEPPSIDPDGIPLSPLM